MDGFDIAKLSKEEILGNEKIKALYVKNYKAFFGNTPNCIKCSFNKDFNKFKRFLTGKTESDLVILKQKQMNNFKLKKGHSLKIFSYAKNKRVHRRFGKDLDNDFVAELIKFDKKNEQFFEELPKKTAPKKSTKTAKKTAPKKTEVDTEIKLDVNEENTSE